jgi:hypothetical protein
MIDAAAAGGISESPIGGTCEKLPARTDDKGRFG